MEPGKTGKKGSRDARWDYGSWDFVKSDLGHFVFFFKPLNWCTAVLPYHVRTHVYTTHAHPTHTMRKQLDLQLQVNWKTASFLDHRDHAFVGDGRVAISLWLHTIKAVDYF